MKKTITIESVSRKPKPPENPGRDWVKYGFYAENMWWNFFAATWNEDLQLLQEGDTVEIYYVLNEWPKGSGRFSNMIVNPNSPDIVAEREKEERFIKIENRLDILEMQLAEDEEDPSIPT